MRKVIWIVFALAFLTLNICLLVPMFGRGMSWQEAALGIIPGALVALVCFALLVAGIGPPAGARSLAVPLWAAALLWALLLGGIVTYVTHSSYQENMSMARSERMSSSRTGYSYSSYSSYARQDQTGMIYGWALLGFAGIALVGLVVSFALSKRAKPASAT